MRIGANADAAARPAGGWALRKAEAAAAVNSALQPPQCWAETGLLLAWAADGAPENLPLRLLWTHVGSVARVSCDEAVLALACRQTAGGCAVSADGRALVVPAGPPFSWMRQAVAGAPPDVRADAQLGQMVFVAPLEPARAGLEAAGARVWPLAEILVGAAARSGAAADRVRPLGEGVAQFGSAAAAAAWVAQAPGAAARAGDTWTALLAAVGRRAAAARAAAARPPLLPGRNVTAALVTNLHPRTTARAVARFLRLVAPVVRVEHPFRGSSRVAAVVFPTRRDFDRVAHFYGSDAFAHVRPERSPVLVSSVRGSFASLPLVRLVPMDLPDSLSCAGRPETFAEVEES